MDCLLYLPLRRQVDDLRLCFCTCHWYENLITHGRVVVLVHLCDKFAMRVCVFALVIGTTSRLCIWIVCCTCHSDDKIIMCVCAFALVIGTTSRLCIWIVCCTCHSDDKTIMCVYALHLSLVRQIDCSYGLAVVFAIHVTNCHEYGKSVVLVTHLTSWLCISFTFALATGVASPFQID